MKQLITLLCVMLLAGTSCKHINTAKKLGETTCQNAKVCMDKAKTIQTSTWRQLRSFHLETGNANSTMVPDDAVPTRLLSW